MSYKIFFTSLLSVFVTTLIGCGGESNGDEPTPPVTDQYPDKVKVEVLEYLPAPGQFVNVIPQYTKGDSYSDMLQKCTDALNNSEMISLGAWGGSVTLRLLRPITNTPGESDFRVIGNSYYAGMVDGAYFGSSEPGIVYVMTDKNANGKPDDGTWIELKGEYTDTAADSRQMVTTEYSFIPSDDNSSDCIAWNCSDGTSGNIPVLPEFHTQPYFPVWNDNITTMVKEGRRLPDNGKYNESNGNYELFCYAGYADSYPDKDAKSALNLDDAFDPTTGNAVNIQKIDFIRVVTGVLQNNGAIGECSTEIIAIEQLHE